MSPRDANRQWQRQVAENSMDLDDVGAWEIIAVVVVPLLLIVMAGQVYWLRKLDDRMVKQIQEVAHLRGVVQSFIEFWKQNNNRQK